MHARIDPPAAHRKSYTTANPCRATLSWLGRRRGAALHPGPLGWQASRGRRRQTGSGRDERRQWANSWGPVGKGRWCGKGRMDCRVGGSRWSESLAGGGTPSRGAGHDPQGSNLGAGWRSRDGPCLDRAGASSARRRSQQGRHCGRGAPARAQVPPARTGRG